MIRILDNTLFAFMNGDSVILSPYSFDGSDKILDEYKDRVGGSYYTVSLDYPSYGLTIDWLCQDGMKPNPDQYVLLLELFHKFLDDQ